MSLIIKALFTGMCVGVLCTKINLPLPAPNSIVGVAGILGIYLGYVLVTYITNLKG